MTKSSKTTHKLRTFRQYLTPEYLILCNDAIIATDQSVSIVRLIDQVAALVFPMQLTRFVIVAQFARDEQISLDDFLRAGLVHKFVLVSPSGETLDLETFPCTIDRNNPWTTSRSFSDQSGLISLPSAGPYIIKLLGKTADSEFEELLIKKLPAVLSFGVAGLYSAEFSADPNGRSAESQGGGYVLLMPNGRIQGRDHGYSYEGSYRLENDSLLGSLTVQRHNPVVKSIFGDLDRFGLDLKGTAEAGRVKLEGNRTDKPSEKIWITLKRETTVPAPTQ